MMRPFPFFNIALLSEGVLASLISPAAFAAPAGETVASLPIKPGFYLDASMPCDQARLGLLNFVGPKGVNGDRFVRIARTGPSTYRAVEDKSQAGGDNASVVVYDVTGPDSFTMKSDLGTFYMRFCPQESLPAPFKTMDVKDQLK